MSFARGNFPRGNFPRESSPSTQKFVSNEKINLLQKKQSLKCLTSFLILDRLYHSNFINKSNRDLENRNFKMFYDRNIILILGHFHSLPKLQNIEIKKS